MMGNCEVCGYWSDFDYCPLCGEWFCSSCWGECDDKDCARCISVMSVHAR